MGFIMFVCYKVDEENWDAGCIQSATITGTVYSAWNGALWLVEPSVYIAFCLKGRLAFVAVWKKKVENMTE